MTLVNDIHNICLKLKYFKEEIILSGILHVVLGRRVPLYNYRFRSYN